MLAIDAKVRIADRESHAVAVSLAGLHGRVDEAEEPELGTIERGAPHLAGTAERKLTATTSGRKREWCRIGKFLLRLAFNRGIRDPEDASHGRLSDPFHPHAEAAGRVSLGAVVEFERAGPCRRHHEHGLFTSAECLDRKGHGVVGRFDLESDDVATPFRLADDLHVGEHADLSIELGRGILEPLGVDRHSG